jgi:hypothetical protein
MNRVDYLKTAKPDLVVDLELYTRGRTLPIGLGWGCPCTIQHEQEAGWVAYDGWPLLIDGPMSPGDSRRVGYVFLMGQEAVRYFLRAEKFYLLENRIIGEARIVTSDNSN